VRYYIGIKSSNESNVINVALDPWSYLSTGPIPSKS